MQVLPVIDILKQQVVRGVAGRRDEYRPIVSLWAASAEPLAIATGLKAAFGCRRFYLADLDAILFHRPNVAVYRQLIEAGFDLLVDAGLRQVDQAAELLECGVVAVIAGLESIPGPATLSELVARHGAERVIFSLDLKGGVPNAAEGAAWPQLSPDAIVETAAACGVKRLIVLDLADVGTGAGGSTHQLCRHLRRKLPHLRLIAGGGVRGEDDICRWEDVGIDDLLVASALHDGRLSAQFLRRYV